MAVTQDYDSMYRDGLDGYIGIKLVQERLEMVTVIDISTVHEEKRRMAKKLAGKMGSFKHENLLNILRPVRMIKTHIPDGLLIIESEAPDHRLSWKTFCKLDFDLE